MLCVYWVAKDGSSRPEVFLGRGVQKICSKFTGEHLRRSTISTKLQSNFIEITLPHGCSPVNLLHIFRTPFLKNTSGRLLLKMSVSILDKKRFQFSSINLFPPSLLSINRMYFPSFDGKLFLIAQTAHDGITLRTPFLKLL